MKPDAGGTRLFAANAGGCACGGAAQPHGNQLRARLPRKIAAWKPLRARASGDIEMAVVGRVGRESYSSFIRLYLCLDRLGRGCNRISKLLKRLIIILRIVYQPRSSPAGLHANARRRNQIEIYFSIVQRNPTVQPTARRSSSENNSCARSAAGTPRSGNWTRPAHVVGSARCHHRRKLLMRSLQYERDQPEPI